MEHNKYATRKTQCRCSVTGCKGEIIETFERTEERDTSQPIVFGPRRATTIVRVKSLGLGCNICGVQYGLPVYKKTKPDNQVQFELDLHVGTLKKKIECPDLAKIQTGKKYSSMEAMSAAIREKTFVQPEWIEQTAVPQLISDLKEGDTVYIVSEKKKYRF